MRYPSPYSLALLFIALSSAGVEARKPSFALERIEDNQAPKKVVRYRVLPPCSRKSSCEIRDSGVIRRIQEKKLCRNKVRSLIYDPKAEEAIITLSDSNFFPAVAAVLSEKPLLRRRYKNLVKVTIEIKTPTAEPQLREMYKQFQPNKRNFPHLKSSSLDLVVFASPPPGGVAQAISPQQGALVSPQQVKAIITTPLTSLPAYSPQPPTCPPPPVSAFHIY